MTLNELNLHFNSEILRLEDNRGPVSYHCLVGTLWLVMITKAHTQKKVSPYQIYPTVHVRVI